MINSGTSSEATPLYTGIMAYNINNGNNRSTPTSDNGSSSNFASTISQLAHATFTKQNIEAATKYTKEKAIELQKQAQDGDHSLRFLGVVAGLACVVVGIIELVSRFLRFDIVGALIDFYIIVLGVIVIVLEGK
jgi:Flp pilus assembly protein TadB